MVTLQLQAADLERLRFAFSPLLETTLSYNALRRTNLHASLSPWVDEAQRALFGVELPYMDAVMVTKHYIADFATPTPTGVRRTMEQELALMADTPPEVIRENVTEIFRHDDESEIRRHFLVAPHEALDCLIEELRWYWKAVLAHHWARMETVLENDVLYRARQMALTGVDEMIGELHPERLSYGQGALHIRKEQCPSYKSNLTLAGDGVQFVPAVFAVCGVWWQVSPHWLPMIIYTARGQGLWYSAPLPDPEAALELTLGAGKARLLYALATPAHTTELARQLHLTAGAVSQQLGRLAAAGLVESHRDSYHVYYRLTERGEKLIALFMA